MSVYNLKINDSQIVIGKINKIFSTFVLVEFDDKIGICHIREVSDYLVKDINFFFKIGENYHFVLLENPENNRYNLSYKAINPKLLKNHKSLIPTISDFNNLKKFVDNLIS